MKVQCPCCHAETERKSVYHRNHCPAMNNVTYGTAKEAAAAALGAIELVVCHTCGVVFNCVFDASLLNYDCRYDSSRSTSRVYTAYLDKLTARVAAGIGRERRILEVGCGNGDFLRRLCNQTGASGFGYDTTYSGENLYGTVTFYKEYFVPAKSLHQHDMLILRHVLEHISQPRTFLKEMCRPEILARGAKIFIETPDLDWIVKRGAFYDVTYEHCNYFTRESLAALVSSVGFRVIQTDNVFDGQYLLLEGIYDEEDVKTQDYPVVSDRPDLAAILEAVRKRFSDIIHGAETVCLWGASGKGVLFLSNFGADLLQEIGYVVDINRNKQGRYLPGSAKYVQAPEVLKQVKGCIDVIIMNEVYCHEIESALQEMGVISRTHIC